ncbi:MAG: uracil-DNA glycosylase [Planctomycetes bacterium]|nr:uracil-DNA glycosylase [Planctomycetota bacterium]
MTTPKDSAEKALEVERFFGTEILFGAAGPEAAQKRPMTLEDVRAWVDDCKKCRLHEGRTNIVFGEGSPSARLVFVGEGPGADEDREGRPFIGRAGKMLTRIIENVLNLTREDVYIANIVKCRPPGNRNPQADECAMCMPYLTAQLEVIRPEVIVTLGSVATHNLLNTKTPIGRLRGTFHQWGNTRLMPTYHTAYLLRNPAEKRKVYDDMLMVKDALGL